MHLTILLIPDLSFNSKIFTRLSQEIMEHSKSEKILRCLCEVEIRKLRKSSETKRYIFETSRKVLTSIDTTRLATCHSQLFVYC